MIGRRDPLALAALGLAGVAFAGSLTHVQATVAAHGQDGWLSWAIALMPEVMVGLSILKVRRRTGDLWAWVVGVSAVGFTLAANLAQAEFSVWGWVAAGWPAWAAVAAAGMIELAPREPVKVVRRERSKPQVSAPMDRPVEPPVERVTLRDVNRPDRSIAARQAEVQRLKAAGKTQAQIVAELTRQGFRASLSTVKRDLAEVAA